MEILHHLSFVLCIFFCQQNLAVLLKQHFASANKNAWLFCLKLPAFWKPFLKTVCVSAYVCVPICDCLSI